MLCVGNRATIVKGTTASKRTPPYVHGQAAGQCSFHDSTRDFERQIGRKSHGPSEAAQERISCAREHFRSCRLVWQDSGDCNCPNHRGKDRKERALFVSNPSTRHKGEYSILVFGYLHHGSEPSVHDRPAPTRAQVPPTGTHTRRDRNVPGSGRPSQSPSRPSPVGTFLQLESGGRLLLECLA